MYLRELLPIKVDITLVQQPAVAAVVIYRDILETERGTIAALHPETNRVVVRETAVTQNHAALQASSTMRVLVELAIRRANRTSDIV